MESCGRNEQGALGLQLPAHVGQVGSCPRRRQGGHRNFARRQHGAARPMLADFPQVRGRPDMAARHDERFLQIGARDDQLVPVAPGMGGGEEDAADRLDLAIQAKLPVQLTGRRIGLRRELPGGHQDTEGHRQLETPAFFGDLRRCEIDDDPPGGIVETAGQQRGPHPLAAFLHDRGRQAHDVEHRQAAGERYFHLYQRR